MPAILEVGVRCACGGLVIKYVSVESTHWQCCRCNARHDLEGGWSRAIEEGKLKKDDLIEHRKAPARGPEAEPGGRDRDERGR